ncbi:MAG: carbamoyl-phosphate synthase (glutamine-hydrolyzing) large subunit [Candidatus Micrarchaeota archaeon]
MNKNEAVKKVMLIGSGPIKIAEAAEFDYSGSQALKALREEGIESILVNPNVATVQTSYRLADKVYMLPLNTDFVSRVIERERPDGIMIGFGGQTALSIGVSLYKKGILSKYNVKVLGTPIEGIEKALSREKFKETMREHSIPVPESRSAKNEEEALNAATEIGYPLMIRASFNLGGRGSSVVRSRKQLESALKKAFAQSSIGEILLEKYLEGWKEIEYEVVRDKFGTVAVTACLENLDPMGVHTGESIVVAPAQTLDNYIYQKMRSVAIKVAEAIGLVGECNVQFALDPKSYNFYVIETNPRMSRSSALASKATGYPLAYISAKLALGYRLQDIKNSVSKATTALFEPSLDYIVVKIPRWDLEKFESVKKEIGTEMKSIGEVMAIGRSFEEALQKGIRMLDIGEIGVVGGRIYNSKMSAKEAIQKLKEKRYWPLYAAKAFKEGASVEQVFRATMIDRFWLEKIKHLVEIYEAYKKGEKGVDIESMKALGFAATQLGNSGNDVIIKQIDTLAGEWPADANYLYSTYSGSEDDIRPKKNERRLLIAGAGVFRIGVSVEFDWSAVSLAESAKRYFDKVAIINYNPETVSTDWDIVDELYFDELTAETITNIYRKMHFDKLAIFAAGQIGNTLSKALRKRGISFLGTSARSIDIAEDRQKFSKLLEKLGIMQPEWVSATSIKEMKKFVDDVGFPVLVRPSYVLSGSSMKIAHSWSSLKRYISSAHAISSEHPVVVSKFMSNAVEAELDCAGDGENVIGITLQHVEEAGVHSGDATIFTPYINGRSSQERMKEIALRLTSELDIKGPFNLQFIVKDDKPYVIELNLRASRSMPFSSKSVGIDLMNYSLKGIFGKYQWNGFFEPRHMSYAVKSPQFGWSQLRGAYPFLGPEMRSTGESASLGTSLNDALIKSWLGVSPNNLPKKAALVYGNSNKESLEAAEKALSKSVDTYTLEGFEIGSAKSINAEKAAEMLRNSKIDMLVTDNNLRRYDYIVRRAAADFNVPMILNGRLGKAIAEAANAKTTAYDLREYWGRSPDR